MSERWIPAAELAELMGVSRSTVTRWTAAGMPSENWGMARTRRYLGSECVAWARARRTSSTVALDRSSARRLTPAGPHREEQIADA